jgi:hypothetical protein
VHNVPFYFLFRFCNSFQFKILFGILILFESVQTSKLGKWCQVLNSSEESELGLQIQEILVKPFIKYS